ncbi:hypothetical protein VTK73DRAFT_4089 [Phialemonium thermophilum]|uniref:Uncharacterized protein n=1 Tax=Phialemonium thermophilum TaxID=223376 RepID=A0ABR3VBL8_9PEZI
MYNPGRTGRPSRIPCVSSCAKPVVTACVVAQPREKRHVANDQLWTCIQQVWARTIPVLHKPTELSARLSQNEHRPLSSSSALDRRGPVVHHPVQPIVECLAVPHVGPAANWEIPIHSLLRDGPYVLPEPPQLLLPPARCAFTSFSASTSATSTAPEATGFSADRTAKRHWRTPWTISYLRIFFSGMRFSACLTPNRRRPRLMPYSSHRDSLSVACNPSTRIYT